MNAGAKVKNYQMTLLIENGDKTGEMSGRFTGRIKTRVQNEYITLPILVVRELSPRWEIKLGPYIAYRIDGSFTGSAFDGYIRDGDPTGTKVGVESATYDFGYGLRRFNWGGQFGAEWQAYRHLSVYADLTCAANSIFKKDFHSVSFEMCIRDRRKHLDPDRFSSRTANIPLTDTVVNSPHLRNRCV